MLDLLRVGPALVLLWFGASAQAIVLDWSTITWTPGSLNNSYDIDATNPGNDVAITVSGDTAQLQVEIIAPYPQTPAITTDFQGGQPVPVNTLSLALDLANQTQGVTFTLDFSAQYLQGVTNVSFQIFDVDFATSASSNYQDQLRNITALSIDGTTLIAPTITISFNNSLSGSGVNQLVDGIASTVDLGAGSEAANVTIDFGSAMLQSLTFTYGSGSGTVVDPTYQHIGIHNISFTAVPEANAALGAMLLCAAAIGLARFQRAQKPK